MTISEKLFTIAENQQKVYDAGYDKGRSDGCAKTNVVVTKAPTCLEEGAATFVCAGCGAVGTEVLPVIDHAYVDGVCTMCGVKDMDYLNKYPVTDTLKGLYDLGGTEEATLVNHAPNATNSTTVEGMTVDGGYATFSGSTSAGRMRTRILLPLADGITLIALFSVPTGNRPIIGNRRGIGSSATHFGINLENSCVRLCISDKEETVHSYDTPINSDNFVVLAMTADTSGYRVVRYTPNGDKTLTELRSYAGAISAWNTASTMATSNGFSIGGDSVSNIRDTAHIALAAIHKGSMTDEQLESICAFVSSYGRYKGLVIE